MLKSKHYDSFKFILYFTIIYFFVLPKPAHAYLDAGNGSYLFQILIAGVLSSTFFFKSTVNKVKDFFKQKDQDKENKSNG